MAQMIKFRPRKARLGLLDSLEEDGRSHTVRMTDFVQEPKLKELLNLLKRLSSQSKP